MQIFLCLVSRGVHISEGDHAGEVPLVRGLLDRRVGEGGALIEHAVGAHEVVPWLQHCCSRCHRHVTRGRQDRGASWQRRKGGGGAVLLEASWPRAAEHHVDDTVLVLVGTKKFRHIVFGWGAAANEGNVQASHVGNTRVSQKPNFAVSKLRPSLGKQRRYSWGCRIGAENKVQRHCGLDFATFQLLCEEMQCQPVIDSLKSRTHRAGLGSLHGCLPTHHL